MNNHIYLQLISLNKTYNNHFLKRYVKLVSFYKERNWSETSGLHEHHIIPESFGGPDTTENLVFITIREHFVLHWMLYKAFPNSSMTTAFKLMCNHWGKDFRITSKVYENMMIESRKIQSETARKNNLKRVEEGIHPWQDKEKASKRAKKIVAEGRHHFSGPETNNKKLENGTHPWQDKEKQSQRAKKRTIDGKNPFSGPELQNKRIAEGKHPFLCINYQKILCPYCNKEFNKGNFSRWHGDKCKLKPK